MEGKENIVEQVPARALTRNQQQERGDTSRASSRVGVEGMHGKERQRGAAVTNVSEDIRQRTSADAKSSSSSHYLMYRCVCLHTCMCTMDLPGAYGGQKRVSDFLELKL